MVLLLEMSKGILVTKVLPFLGLRFPNRYFIAPFARRMGIHLISISAMSNTSEEFELRLLGSLMIFLMAHAFLVWATNLMLMLLVPSPKGPLTSGRMVCLLLGPCTIALFVREMGIKRAIAIGVSNSCAEVDLLGLWMFIAVLMA